MPEHPDECPSCHAPLIRRHLVSAVEIEDGHDERDLKLTMCNKCYQIYEILAPEQPNRALSVEECLKLPEEMQVVFGGFLLHRIFGHVGDPENN